ncbi:hypothetical protein CZ771_05800 [Actinomycetales bacterium JB111]|nr:hypothetical protein CZ771_05800 [Actinomycetales bacterium JB111]
MKYVMLLMGYHDGPSCGEDEAPGEEEFMAFDAELEKAGVNAGGIALAADPEDFTSVTKASRDAEAVVTAGPYPESREFVGGTWILDVKDLDEALEWAKKCPAAVGGRIEIRPLLEF